MRSAVCMRREIAKRMRDGALQAGAPRRATCCAHVRQLTALAFDQRATQARAGAAT